MAEDNLYFSESKGLLCEYIERTDSYDVLIGGRVLLMLICTKL